MEKQALTVNEFCQRYSISRSLFYKMRRLGNGPAIAKMNNKTLVLADEIRRWEAAITRPR